MPNQFTGCTAVTFNKARSLLIYSSVNKPGLHGLRMVCHDCSMYFPIASTKELEMLRDALRNHCATLAQRKQKN